MQSASSSFPHPKLDYLSSTNLIHSGCSQIYPSLLNLNPQGYFYHLLRSTLLAKSFPFLFSIPIREVLTLIVHNSITDTYRKSYINPLLYSLNVQLRNLLILAHLVNILFHLSYSNYSSSDHSGPSKVHVCLLLTYFIRKR